MKRVVKLFAIFSLLCLVSPWNTIGQVNWTKYEQNPVFNTWLSFWENSRVSHCCVLFDSTIYRMWYTGNNLAADGSPRIGYATSSDGIEWKRHSLQKDGAVLIGESGQWDRLGVMHPTVVFDGTLFHLWYTGVKNSSEWGIGYATSEDGINWVKYENNPVLSDADAPTWESNAIFKPSVILKDSVFHLWYTGRNDTLRQIGYATSLDGKTWTKYSGNPVFKTGPDRTWDQADVNVGSVVLQDDIFHLWYSGRRTSGAWNIGYATSADGINWERYVDNPVLSPGESDSWDRLNVGGAMVIYDDNIFKMWYNGAAELSPAYPYPSQSRIGYATAPDISKGHYLILLFTVLPWMPYDM